MIEQTNVDEMVQNETEEQPVQDQPQPQQQVQRTNEVNFRALKMERDRIEYERNEALRRLQEYERIPKQQKTDDDLGMAPDDIAEGRHFNKLYEQNKILKQEIEAIKSKTLEETAEARIAAKYPDFYTIVNSDSMTALRQADPEMADTLNDGKDLYKKAVSVYKAIKSLGIQTNGTEADKRKAQENSAKPRPMASVSPQQGESPLSHANAFANGLTPELQKQLWKEMQDAKKGF